MLPPSQQLQIIPCRPPWHPLNTPPPSRTRPPSASGSTTATSAAHLPGTTEPPQTTYLLSDFETNLNVDTRTINDKDVKVWRLNLLNNSDGDETNSPREANVAAEEDRMKGYLNSIEAECEKVFGELPASFITVSWPCSLYCVIIVLSRLRVLV